MIAWEDRRSGGYDMYAQRLNASGDAAVDGRRHPDL